jgi:hypothetical protein
MRGPTRHRRLLRATRMAVPPRPWQGARGRPCPAPGPGLRRLHSTFESLAVPEFRALWIGLLIGMAGMQMMMIASTRNRNRASSSFKAVYPPFCLLSKPKQRVRRLTRDAGKISPELSALLGDRTS